MKQIFISSLTACLFFISLSLVARDGIDRKADSVLNKYGEIYFSFKVEDRQMIHRLTRMISIDRVDGKLVHAYANREEFEQFSKTGIRFEILQNPGSLLSEAELNPNRGYTSDKPVTQWNFYPGYTQYLDFMNGFASTYPDICKLDTIGTSVQGRLLLAVRISDNAGNDEAEPQVLYTSSIHGDETAGYVLMLHLIDHLLLNYGTDPEITALVNSHEIFINPLANPDGTFKGGNNTVMGSVRYNANNVDLNRNYPDPKLGPHPDGKSWQPETVAFMDYADKYNFTLSANFHGGAEVFNYPWDTWAKLHPDTDWWELVGREWADTAHKYSAPGYFTLQNNGVTNGYAWYELNGGRQDFMNYWHGCREVTLEISNIKTLPAPQLINWWNYNYRSFLNYIRQSGYGINGIVTDTVTDEPVAAKVFITGHDEDNSEVYSRLPSGFYARPIIDGTYDVTFSAPGYFSKTISNVQVSDYSATILNVQLRPLTYALQDQVEQKMMVYPNPSNGRFKITLPDGMVHPLCSLQVFNALGEIVHTESRRCDQGGKTLDIVIEGLQTGIYFLKFNSGYKIYIDKLIVR